MLQLPQRLRLDLADALARHRERLADLLERRVGVLPTLLRPRSPTGFEAVKYAQHDKSLAVAAIPKHIGCVQDLKPYLAKVDTPPARAAEFRMILDSPGFR